MILPQTLVYKVCVRQTLLGGNTATGLGYYLARWGHLTRRRPWRSVEQCIIDICISLRRAWSFYGRITTRPFVGLTTSRPLRVGRRGTILPLPLPLIGRRVLGIIICHVPGHAMRYCVLML
jgi:hypothetical protein